jgi:plasmid replication initiation protein
MPTKDKKQVVVQHNNLIESKYKITTLEQRFILALVSKIERNDQKFITYEITLTELASLMGISITNMYIEIGRLADKLMSRVLTISTIHGWKKMQWLSYCEYNKKRTVVVCSFHPKLKPFLIQLKEKFTIYDLSIIARLQSVYSIRIYQLLKQYVSIGKRTFELDDLKEILGIEKTKYKVFKDFRKCVIDQAKKELDLKSDLSFDLEKIREGRKIKWLKFIIIPTENNKDKPVVDNESEILDDIEHQEAVLLEESANLDEKIFNEFLEYSKENDKVIYDFYLEHGRAPLVQGAYIEFLDKREKEQKAQQGG